MTEQDKPDPTPEALTAELIRREALRRAAAELSTTAPAGVEGVLARISAEVTAAAREKKPRR
ncbi:hypothetical protein [Rhodopila sp.]|uniref:hypothetical protein n=1 Tax=Rhodopila sp. TaxID=2480087 RepID=UPI003D0AD9E0